MDCAAAEQAERTWAGGAMGGGSDAASGKHKKMRSSEVFDRGTSTVPPVLAAKRIVESVLRQPADFLNQPKNY